MKNDINCRYQVRRMWRALLGVWRRGGLGNIGACNSNSNSNSNSIRRGVVVGGNQWEVGSKSSSSTSTKSTLKGQGQVMKKSPALGKEFYFRNPVTTESKIEGDGEEI